ncbi:hypothetical protein Tco_1434517 [Tanacetum coccineum]
MWAAAGSRSKWIGVVDCYWAEGKGDWTGGLIGVSKGICGEAVVMAVGAIGGIRSMGSSKNAYVGTMVLL